MEQSQLSGTTAVRHHGLGSNRAGQPIATSEDRLALLRRWWPVALLSSLYVISLTDRLILAILIEPLKRDLRISDTQIALLIGSSFALFNAVIAVPVAWAIDKSNRLAVGVAGVALWSLSTVGSGLVNQFGPLVALRVGVAIGESVLTPLGVSIIADLFPRERRSVPMSVFIASGIVGIFAAYAMGGGVVALIQHGLVSHVPLIGRLSVWRAALVLIGLPGVFLALLMACSVRVPKRKWDGVEDAATSDDRFGAFASRADLWRFYGFYFAGAGVIGLATIAGLTWYPTFLVRVFHVSLPKSGGLFSLSMIAAAVVLLGIPHAIRYLERRGMVGALAPITLAIAAVGSLLFALSLVQTSLSATLPFLIVGFGLLAGGVNALPSIAVGLAAPAAYRGRIIAIGSSLMGLVAMGLGPYVAAVLADHVFMGPRAIGNSMLTLTICAAPLACILFALSWPPLYPRDASGKSLKGRSKHPITNRNLRRSL